MLMGSGQSQFSADASNITVVLELLGAIISGVSD